MTATAPLPALGPCDIPAPLVQAGCLAVDEGSEVVQDAASSVAGNAVEKVAEAVGEAVADVLVSLTTAWVNIPTPGLGSGEAASQIQGRLWWYMGALAVVSVIIGGARAAWEGRGQPLRDLLRSLGTLVLVTGISLLFISTAVSAGDAFAEWIIGASLQDGSFESNLGKLFVGLTGGSAAVPGAAALAPMIIIVMGFVTILVSVTQIVLMYFRSAALVLLAGVLPLSAAATNTEWGRQWFGKLLAWTVAFILYKPAAAIVYASAITMFGTSDSLQSAIVGVCMIGIAIVALPAIMRLVMPATAALAGGAAGGMGGAMAGLGAASMASRGSGGGGGGAPTGAVSTGAAPPSGPSGSRTAGGNPGLTGRSTAASGAPVQTGAASSGGGAGAGGGAAATSGGAAAGAGAATAAVAAGQAAHGAAKGAAQKGVGDV